MRNWEIKSRSRFCSACESPFQTGQVYHCVLDFGAAEPRRNDYCERCFQEQSLSAARAGPEKAYWRSSFKRLYTPVEEQETIRKDMAQRLLEKYVQSENPEHVNLCYILALLQERNKLLLPRTRTRDRDGAWITVYEYVQTGDTFLIRDPGLSLSEAESVQAQIKQLIDAEKLSDAQAPEAEETPVEALDSEGKKTDESGNATGPTRIESNREI
ncbi:MAG: hypothetical protein NTV79_03650 [Candidatus Aureabacteria bacterium]|nr:hypothetical protein [Candidatus Auribacterota bacterium]